jgi:uncharacterized protein (DUF433 family)
MADVSSLGRFSPSLAARIVGITPARLAQWHRRGVIPRSGPGDTYSYADVGEALLAHYLVDYLGIGLRRVGVVVRNLRDKYGNWPLGTAPLQHEGRFIVVHEGGDLVFSAYRPEQAVIERTLDLQALRSALAHGGWVALKDPRPHVEVNPARLAGQPTVRGRGVPTALVADMAAQPDGRRLLREDYELTEAEIDDAVGYESDVHEALAA